METTVDEETGEDKVYLAYNTYIKDLFVSIISDIFTNICKYIIIYCI